MKNLLLLIALCAGFIGFAQTLSYNDIGVLITNEKIDGTARFNAMSGAFGSLGGDITAIESNPAGAAVFLNSEVAMSLNFNGIDTKASYYGVTSNSNTNPVRFAQAGGVFVFKPNYSANNDGWRKFAFAFDYSTANEFENFWSVIGNSNYPTWTVDPNDDNPLYYDSSDGQYFENSTSGRTNKYTFTVASQYKNNLYIGASLISYNADYYQLTLLEENNYSSLNNDFLEASSIQELSTYGNGFSFNLGLIAKPSKNTRIGLAYQSPVWYNMDETFLEYDTEVYYSNVGQTYSDYSGVSNFYYNLRTPSKVTGSFAYIFDKYGLLSIDYIYKNYSKIELRNGPFGGENQAFRNNMNGVSEVRVGTEWRIKKASVRGGYHFEQSPYKDAISSDNLEGWSAGLGYNFGMVKFDLSYLQSSKTAPYNFYPNYPEVNSVELDFKTSKVTATLIISI
ncbi:hemin receptor [Lutibacter sp. HS1-25]|uniref:OmpP1/FadL family transporter n=1 Tax=Lutibacter sp. HS1-25 TaxID=2485000 RepID=UPI001013BC14|nr:outer membrane protein transport protein [Lutibacter sp. HS1-25]RXP54089.1 hemin receptor [Lutibacter sp. HS1-25]